MKKFEVKYMIGSKGYKQTVEAENEAIAMQRVLSSIKFVSVDELKPTGTPDLSNFNDIFNTLGDIFGGTKNKK